MYHFLFELDLVYQRLAAKVIAEVCVIKWEIGLQITGKTETKQLW